MGFLGTLFSSSKASSSQSTNSTTNQDNRSISSVDSHATTSTNTNSGNTTVNYTGTDGGAVQIAQLQAQLMGAVGEQNLDAVKVIAGLGAGVGGAATDLAALSQQNSLALSTHMLDLTGELIDKIATGTNSAVAEQSSIAQAGATQASAMLQAGTVKLMLIGGAVLAALLLLKK